MTNTNNHVPALKTLVDEGFSNIQIQESLANYYEFTSVIQPLSTDSLIFNTYENHKFLTLIDGLINWGQLNSSLAVRSLLDDLRPRVVFPNRKRNSPYSPPFCVQTSYSKLTSSSALFLWPYLSMPILYI